MRETSSETEFEPYTFDSLPENVRISQAQKDLLDDRSMVMAAHRDMLKTLYHVSLIVDADMDDKTEHYLEVLCKTADFYSCQPVLALHIDNYLRQHQYYILRECEEDPVHTLSFGLYLKSEFITKEVCVHLIGESSNTYADRRPQLIELSVTDLINTVEAKRRLLAERLRAIDFALPTFSLPFEYEDHTARQVALNLFRQAISDAVEFSYAPGLHGNYTYIYRDIARGRLHDLNDDYAAQHVPGPRAFKIIKHDFRTAVKEVLAEAKPIVEPILRDVTQITGARNIDGKLLCMGIDDEDLPWLNKDKVKSP